MPSILKCLYKTQELRCWRLMPGLNLSLAPLPARKMLLMKPLECDAPIWVLISWSANNWSAQEKMSFGVGLSWKAIKINCGILDSWRTKVSVVIVFQFALNWAILTPISKGEGSRRVKGLTRVWSGMRLESHTFWFATDCLAEGEKGDLANSFKFYRWVNKDLLGPLELDPQPEKQPLPFPTWENNCS